MRYLRRDKVEKTIVVISDLHLSAGVIVNNQRNTLEDFHHDKELVEFLNFYCTKEYEKRNVELIINGDFWDFLAVPYVPYYDDEFWSEEAAQDKLKMMLKAHPEVVSALSEFALKPNKKITYIIGNHDAEFILNSVKNIFLEAIGEKACKNFVFLENQNDPYIPSPGIYLIHGHEYERAHHFDSVKNVIKTQTGRKYFIPPWGSYYVTRVVNKFKQQRNYINQVKPIRAFLIKGLIYDTLFTLRFMVANVIYFFMVRFMYIVSQKPKFSKLIEEIAIELKLFLDHEVYTKDFFNRHHDAKVLIVGHTHEAIFRTYGDNRTFINTGTWTKVHNLDFNSKMDGYKLTYAQIDITHKDKETFDYSNTDIALNTWKGISRLPYQEFY